MLIADIKIVPHGHWDSAYAIKRLNIANRGIINPDHPDGVLCQYTAWWSPDPEDEYLRVPEAGTSGVDKVVNFHHVREEGAEKCVSLALAALSL